MPRATMWRWTAAAMSTRRELARRARLKEEARLLAEKERKRREEEQEKARLLELARQEKLAKDRANRPKPPLMEPPKPVPPSFSYKFIGVMGPPESKIAIFLDDQDFFLAKEGEDVKEDFRIVKIGYDTLQIGYTDPQFKEESRILQMGKD